MFTVGGTEFFLNIFSVAALPMLIKNFNTNTEKTCSFFFPTFHELYLTTLSIGQLKYRRQVKEI